VTVGVDQRERDRRGVVLDEHDIGLGAWLQAAQVIAVQGGIETSKRKIHGQLSV
jgi:hypothetical protein